MKIPNKRKLQQIASNHLSDIDSKDSMKISEDYTKEPCSFLVYGATQYQKIHCDLRRTYCKMIIGEKIKTIDNQIEQNKAQYNLDRETAKIFALSSGNVSKYEFLTGIYILSQKDLLEKATTMKILEYFPLDKELKAQTDKH